MKGLAGMSLADLDQESSDHSSGQTKMARESFDSLSSTTNLPQKRGQHEVAHDMQGGKAKKTTAGTSTPTSYVGCLTCWFKGFFPRVSKFQLQSNQEAIQRGQ